MSILGSTDLGNGLTALTIDHDPTSVATDALKGSLIIDANGTHYIKTDDGSTTNVAKIATAASIELTFPISMVTGSNRGDHRVAGVGATGAQRFNFTVPADFGSLVSLDLIGIPSSGAAGSGKDIDLFSDYGAIGENFANHSESDTTTVYDFTGDTDLFITIDLSGIFTSLAVGDLCGCQIDHNAIGGGIDYKCIKMVYTPA